LSRYVLGRHFTLSSSLSDVLFLLAFTWPHADWYCWTVISDAYWYIFLTITADTAVLDRECIPYVVPEDGGNNTFVYGVVVILES
jgi:hypothetical protein